MKNRKECVWHSERGHEAYSCDIQECSGGHLEWHIKGNVLPFLDGNCLFETMDGHMHKQTGRWDMLIAFPPCTHLAVSGAKYFEKKRADGRQAEAIEFFCKFLEADCERIVIENPIGIISGTYVSKWFPWIAEKYNLPRKYSQIIQPYEYGHPVRKSTCLWIKGLPKLEPTDIVPVENDEHGFSYGGSLRWVTDKNGKILPWNDPRTAKERSKTYTGIAKAMADQWG